MLYILHGDDDFSRREALNKLKSSLGPEEDLATNTTILEGKELTLEDLAAVCNTIPFLSKHRLVVVEGLLTRWNGPGRSGKKRGSASKGKKQDLEGWRSMPDMIRSMPETAVLVLNEDNVAVDNPLLKALAPLAQVSQFIPPKGARLQSWVKARVTQEDGSISPSAVKLLVESTGSSLWALSSEIDKLLLYVGSRPITDEDVQRMIAGAREGNIFALVDAVVEGRAQKATRELHRLFQTGASASYILTMLGRQFRLIALARDLERVGVSGSEMGRRLGVTSDYALNKVLDQAALYDIEEVIRCYETVLSADLAVKTGELPERLAVELSVVKLANSRASKSYSRV